MRDHKRVSYQREPIDSPCRRFQYPRKSHNRRSVDSEPVVAWAAEPATTSCREALALASDIEAVWVASDALARLRGSDPVAAPVVDFGNDRLRRGR